MKFFIRDVLWLTVVVALAVGWWVDRRRQVDWEWRAKQLSQAAEDGGLGKVWWNSDDSGFEIQDKAGWTTVYPDSD